VGNGRRGSINSLLECKISGNIAYLMNFEKYFAQGNLPWYMYIEKYFEDDFGKQE
jgi:hypothetical protein